MLWPPEMARPVSHDSLPLAVCHRIEPQIERLTDTHSMDRLFIINPMV
jgi:hypothetical protein